MIDRPAEIYADPHIVERTRDVLREHVGDRSIMQPTRAAIVAALESRTASG
jgi:hypothetical protein